MNALRELALLMLLSIAALWSGKSAHAAFPATSTICGTGPLASACGSTPAAACNAMGALQNSLYPSVYGVKWQAPFTPVGATFCNAANGFGSEMVASGYTCPANSTLVGSSCNCNAGYQQEGGTCVVQQTDEQRYCSEQNGTFAVGVSAPKPSGSSGLSDYTMCYANQYSLSPCSGTLQPDICAENQDGKWFCTGKVAFNASQPCTGTTTPTTPEAVPSPLPEPLPPGKCPGTVNGVTVVVPCSSTTTKTTTEKSGSDSSGNASTESKERQTTCTGAGSCSTTTTTVTTTNGVSVTKTETTTQPKGEFCAQNPGALECGDSSSFGGDCASDFTCQGDAIQCAQALAAKKLQCAAVEVPAEVRDSASSVLGAELPEGLFINGPSLTPPTAMPAAGACPLLDQEIPWLGEHKLNFQLSRFCPYMQSIRAFLGLFGALAFALIVFRG